MYGIIYLLRMLSGLFGGDRVIPFMSVQAVCGGDLPADYEVQDFDLRGWARRSTCLFTVVDDDSLSSVTLKLKSSTTEKLHRIARKHGLLLSQMAEELISSALDMKEDE